MAGARNVERGWPERGFVEVVSVDLWKMARVWCGGGWLWVCGGGGGVVDLWVWFK